MKNKFSVFKNKLWMWANPYNNPNLIISIDTKLPGNSKYSPLFLQTFADTYITLTGSRNRDYRLAEAETKCIHIPKTTVWHHVWEKNSGGKYRMQLVDYSLHQKSCPHAGGCKLWTLEHNMAYKCYRNVYVSEKLLNKKIGKYRVNFVGELRRGRTRIPYADYVIDYIFDEDETYTKSICIRKGQRCVAKRTRVWGLDPYGNIFVVNSKGELFLLDHEFGTIRNCGIKEKDILR